MLQKIFQYNRFIIVLLGIVLLGTIQFYWVRQGLKPMQRLEGLLLDSRYLLRSAQPPHPAIKIIGIEASSLTLDTLSSEEIAASPVLELMQQPWPWDRRVYAEAIKMIMEAGARVVVVDLVFRGHNPGNPELAAVLQQYPGKVVLASFFDAAVSEGEKLQYVPPQQEIVEGHEDALSGYANIWPDADHIVRRARYRTSLEREYGLLEVAGQDLSALSLLAAEKFNGPIQITPGNNEVYIDYSGLPGAYPVVPIEHLFVESLWRNSKATANGAALRDKIVIIGPTAEVFKDVHQTPFGSMTGPEIQANLTATLLQSSWLQDLPRPWILFWEAALIFSAVLISLRAQKAASKAVLLSGAFLLFLLLGGTLFERRIVMPMAPALAGFMTAGASALLLQFAAEQYERLRTRNLLDRYVSRNVAQLIMQDQRTFVESLQGQRKAVTVLFSDIRGFTTMTEGAQAEELVSQLNEYFHEMVGIILREGGTLQKFIGDAIMAVWGDTHTMGAAEDARRAVRSALGMRAALQKLNASWEGRPGRMQLAMGIGINHGEVIVGNIGHPQRMEFTVLGDAVNLASRLESATKGFHQDLLMGESVFHLTQRDFDYRTVDYLVVKGKTMPIEVYTIPAENRGESVLGLQQYHEALDLYRKGEFARALSKFERAGQNLGGSDFLCEMYQLRCQEYLRHPPPKDWNGAHLLKEK